MSKPKVFVSRAIPEAGLALIRAECDADVWPGSLPPPRTELLARVAAADGLLCMLTERVDAELLQAAPRLKVISNFAVGFDNIEVAAATARRIPVGNTPDVLTDATADMAFALLMAAARRIPEGERYVRQGKWQVWDPQLLLGADLSGATLGVVGFGRIGQALARRAQGFDLRVIYHDPGAAPAFGALPVALESLLAESDFISLHVPLKDSTRHMIDGAALAKMKPGTVLVNTARGAVIDTGALLEALRSRPDLSAALDVTDPEPLPGDHPLLTLDNCLVVPHLGSASRRTRADMARLASQNLVAGLRGERLPHCVNPEVYAR
jgi:glyoxylate reductase